MIGLQARMSCETERDQESRHQAMMSKDWRQALIAKLKHVDR